MYPPTTPPPPAKRDTVLTTSAPEALGVTDGDGDGDAEGEAEPATATRRTRLLPLSATKMLSPAASMAICTGLLNSASTPTPSVKPAAVPAPPPPPASVVTMPVPKTSWRMRLFLVVVCPVTHEAASEMNKLPAVTPVVASARPVGRRNSAALAAPSASPQLLVPTPDVAPASVLTSAVPVATTRIWQFSESAT